MPGTSNRGFASMNREKQREIASKGGKNNPNRHRFTPEEAKVAGRKGGLAPHTHRGSTPVLEKELSQ